MNTTKVKIISCYTPTAWYADLIGKEFEVCDESWNETFVLKEDFDRGGNAWWRHILKSDAEVLENPKQ